jgi:phosphoglycerate dehydrogenase-like enzyme
MLSGKGVARAHRIPAPAMRLVFFLFDLLHLDGEAVSVAQARIVDEDALYAALKDGHLGGAALDVWWQYPTSTEPERRPSRRPFHELPNVLMTPHCSSSSDATAERRWSAVAGNLDRFARGEALENVVVRT